MSYIIRTKRKFTFLFSYYSYRSQWDSKYPATIEYRLHILLWEIGWSKDSQNNKP